MNEREIIRNYITKPFTYGDITIHRGDCIERYGTWASLTDDEMMVMAKCVHDMYHWLPTKEKEAALKEVMCYTDFPYRFDKNGKIIKGSEEEGIQYSREHISQVETCISWDCTLILKNLGIEPTFLNLFHGTNLEVKEN